MNGAFQGSFLIIAQGTGETVASRPPSALPGLTCLDDEAHDYGQQGCSCDFSFTSQLCFRNARENEAAGAADAGAWWFEAGVVVLS
jgi:hypothetical protein